MRSYSKGKYSFKHSKSSYFACWWLGDFKTLPPTMKSLQRSDGHWGVGGSMSSLLYAGDTKVTPSLFLSTTVSKLQSFLLQHQTFLEKCETWMEFLVQTEQKLAVEISGNYQHLLEQQRAHEVSGSSSSELTGGFRGQGVGSVSNGACCPAW